MHKLRTRLTGRPWLRVVLVLAWMAAAMALPVTTARACSCAMGDLPAAVGQAEVAFVGTAIDQRQARGDALGGPLVETAFRVDRATAPTPEIALVAAGESDASCGVRFGLGEEWLVVLPPKGALGDMGGDTHLCAGNMRVADIPPGDLAEVEALLTVAPAPPPAEAESGVSTSTLVALGAGLLGLAGVGWFAYHSVRRPAR